MNEVNEFGSMSAGVKNIIMTALSDGKEHDRKELVSIITKEINGDVSSGVIAGGFKMLTIKGEIEVTRRGVYRSVTSNGTVDLKQQVENLFVRLQKDLDRLCTVNALQLEDTDIDFLRKVKNISNNLEADIWILIDGKEEAKTGVEEQVEDTAKPEDKVEGVVESGIIATDIGENDKQEEKGVAKVVDNATAKKEENNLVKSEEKAASKKSEIKKA